MKEKDLSSWMKVGMGEFKKAGKEINQYSLDFFPCFGVGFYNPSTDESYMLHYTDLFFYDFEKSVDLVKENLGSSGLEVYAMGGGMDSLESEDYNLSILEDRKVIENSLKKNFPDSNVVFNWNFKEGYFNFYLDKSKKEFYTLEN
jgi:hypothetical protein